MTASVSRPVEHGLDRLALPGPQRLEAERLARDALDPVRGGHAGRIPTGARRGNPSRLCSPAVTTHPWTGRRLHFVGIGGAGMSGLALVARSLGAEVTGSDRSAGLRLPRRRCARSACEPAAGHDAAHVPDGAEVVVSSAIPPENPERAVAARARPARAAPRRPAGRADAAQADDRRHRHPRQDDDVEHGRPRAARRGLDPSYLVGGEVRSTGANAGWGAGEWLVVEADESDRSLLKLAPRIAVLTNAELDHHTTYSSRRDVDETFRAFLGARRAGGRLGPPGAARARRRRPRDAVRRPRARAGRARLALRARRRRGER